MSAVAGFGTSIGEDRTLLKWLQHNDIDSSSLEAFRAGIDAAPISYTTKNFFLARTHQLPELGNKCILGNNGVSYLDAQAVVRDDFTALLEDLGNKNYSVVPATSPKQTGKTMGCVTSLLRARHKVLKVPDNLLVLATGSELPLQHLKTILAVCMHCGLPLILDELENATAYAKGVKVFIEDGAFRNMKKPPLSVLLMGSEQQAMYNASVAALGGMDHMGVAPVTLLPAPSLGLIVTMLEVRYPGLQGDEFAGQVLSNLARSGINLQQHWTGQPPTVQQLCATELTDLTKLPPELAHAVHVEHMTAGSAAEGGSLVEEENARAMRMLAKFGFIRPRVVAGVFKPRLYDYTDYRLITNRVFKGLSSKDNISQDDLDAALAAAEGKVLEEVIRTEEGSVLLMQLLGLQESRKAKQVLRYYGDLAKGEINMLLVQKVTDADSEQYNLFLCSVKRTESQQEVDTFTKHMDHLYTLSKDLRQRLLKARELTPVAICCLSVPGHVDDLSERMVHEYTLPLRRQSKEQQGGQQQQQQQEDSCSAEEGQLAVVVPVRPLRRVLFKDIIAEAQRMPMAEAYAVPCHI